MNWEAAGAIGEIVGAIAVVVTLAYFATQMKQTTKALRSGALHAYRIESVSALEVSELHAEVFAKARNGEELNEVDKGILRSYAYRLFGLMETVYLNYQDGSVSKEVFEARMSGFKQAMNTQFLKDSWPIWKRYDFTQSFVDYVESQILR